MKKIVGFGHYLKEKFGKVIRKVPVSIPGFTCPNIDGRVGRGGCIFCENESFSPNFQRSRFTLNLESKENPLLPSQLQALQTQFFRTAPILKRYYRAEGFIIYFQSFTNTYAPLETLRQLYLKALSLPGVIGISVGTRTDSVTEPILDFLAELGERWEVWIEYGVQSSNNATLQRINRGHTFQNVVEWSSKTLARGLPMCAHLIFGLPGEGREEMLQSVKDTISLGFKSYKFHPLYITRNTLLAKEYLKGTYIPLKREEYLKLLAEGLKLLPDGVSVQRITAGSPKALAPEWCRQKGKLISYLVKGLKKEGIQIWDN